MKETIGFIGTGIMGSLMVKNLTSAGYDVVVYNRTKDKARNLGKVVDSAKEVAERAKIILCCVSDAEAVREVTLGKQGIILGIRGGTVFVDFTTNFPKVSKEIAEKLEENGAYMLDAPVSGGDAGAKKGTLSIMVGGKKDIFERVKPILNKLGNTTHIGDNVGDGGYAKLVNQMIVAANLASMGEALVFGAKAGLDMDKLANALKGGFANSEVLKIKMPKVLSGEFSPGARAEIQLKDMDYIHKAIESMGLSLPITELVRNLFRKLCEAGYSNEDHSAIIRIFEKVAGVKARR